MGWSLFGLTGLMYKDSRCAGGNTLVAPIGGDATYLLDGDGPCRASIPARREIWAKVQTIVTCARPARRRSARSSIQKRRAQRRTGIRHS